MSPAGRPREISDEEILREIRDAEDDWRTAPELAQELGITRWGMHKRLVQLEEEGIVEQQKLNRSTAIWRLC
jgi:predicted ArsR family transcriptional regulator